MKKVLVMSAALVASAISFSAMAGGDIQAGKAAAEKNNCFTCHGKDYKSPSDPGNPKLAGQHQDYLAHALTAYQRGGGSAAGRGNAIMSAQVKSLSRKDILDIAAYLHSLPGSLVLKK